MTPVNSLVLPFLWQKRFCPLRTLTQQCGKRYSDENECRVKMLIENNISGENKRYCLWWFYSYWYGRKFLSFIIHYVLFQTIAPILALLLHSGGSRISLRWGPQPSTMEHQPKILTNLPKNCMKLKESGPQGRVSCAPLPLDPPMLYEQCCNVTCCYEWVRKTAASVSVSVSALNIYNGILFSLLSVSRLTS